MPAFPLARALLTLPLPPGLLTPPPPADPAPKDPSA